MSRKDDDSDKVATLNVLRQGEFFGESVVSAVGARVATVTAVTKSILFRLPKAVLVSTLGDDLQASVSRNLTHKVLSSMDLFKPLTRVERDVVFEAVPDLAGYIAVTS